MKDKNADRKGPPIRLREPVDDGHAHAEGIIEAEAERYAGAEFERRAEAEE